MQKADIIDSNWGNICKVPQKESLCKHMLTKQRSRNMKKMGTVLKNLSTHHTCTSCRHGAVCWHSVVRQHKYELREQSNRLHNLMPNGQWFKQATLSATKMSVVSNRMAPEPAAKAGEANLKTYDGSHLTTLCECSFKNAHSRRDHSMCYIARCKTTSTAVS